MSFYWTEYNEHDPNIDKAESPEARMKRWESNISGFMMDLSAQTERTNTTLDEVVSALNAIAEGFKKMGPSERGNIIERAYALALMQERQEMQEHLQELMIGMGTIGEVQEFMAQRPELKAFYDKVVTGTLPEAE